ncbi:MAG: iron ABC transporter permease [Proteobacteria bacterium]|nr:iron ABC transporter permease [Pseudomonadota bacterium]MCP4919885.1 iron ABC transporter permease [Pseudomonadota bacterium]
MAGSIGLAGAWLTARMQLAGRPLLLALLASPLAVPPYLVALTWLDLTGPTGPLKDTIELHGSLTLAAILLGVCTSPLVLLGARAALERLDPRIEEAAATLGLGPFERAYRVVIPAIRPALGAGVALVVLYAFADFGAVSALGVKTFTRAIYFELDLGIADRAQAWSAASRLALVLLAIAIPVFVLEQRSRGPGRYEQGGRRRTPARSLGGTVAAWVLALGVFGTTAGLVVGRALWHARSLDASIAERTWEQAATALRHSASWAAAAATAAVIVALVLAWFASRTSDRFHVGARNAASLGFVLPGPVVALGVLILLAGAGAVGHTLEGTAFILVTAYVVRFLPEAIQTTSGGMAQAPRRLEEAARSLGRSPLRSVIQVTLPLLRGSLLASWVLVFTAALRELPATLLLSPLGSRALSSEIWSFAKDSHYARMAPSALLLVGFTLPAIAFLLWGELSRRST